MAPTAQPPTSSQESTQKPPAPDEASRAQAIHAVSVACVVICPIIIALPPRKFDAYTIALLSGTFFGSNQLAQEYTGRSILTRIQGSPTSKQPFPPLGHAADERDKEAVLGRKAFERGNETKDGFKGRIGVEASATNTKILEELRKKKEDEEGAEPGVTPKNSSTGSQKPAWKKERDEREREALDAGRGYGSLILDQIWDVWTWGETKPSEVNTTDDKAVEPKEGKGKGNR